jgi:hypothetical protein
MKKILLLLLLPILTFGQKEVVVHITTDSYPSETKWTLYKDVYEGDTLGYVEYGHYTQANTSYTDTLYIPDSITNISWVIWDSWGDGMPGGSYYVTICEDTIINYPIPTFAYGLIHNRTVPQCMPNPPPCVPAKVVINLDQYQGETSWDIKDTNGIVYAQSVTYAGHPDYATIIVPVCIPKGPLEFTIYDTYGDGLNGALWQGQDGSYYLTQCNDTLVHGTDPAFGFDTTHVFVSDSCPPIYGCTDPDYIEFNHFADVDDGSCSVLKVYGCIDSTMFNYDSTANTMNMIDSCDYTLVLHDLMGNGWVGSSLKIYADDTTEYYNTGGFDDIYNIGLKAPRPVSFQFFISAQASLTTIECGFTLINPEGDTIISVQPPFIQPLFLYSAITNCGNTCVEKVFGCPDTLACNYVSGVNTPTSCTYPVTYYNCNNECISDIDNDGVCDELEVVGCQDPLMYNYNILATDSGACEPFIYGCTDPTMFNYNPLANTDNGNCEPYIFGCTDSTMFNFNPLANADNNSCVPYIYGCTDPSMLNYNPDANTEDFSCVPYIYGCMDSTALNYDSLANTDNGSCIEVVAGCMDQSAYNYNISANVHDSISCLFDAGCVTGAGNPYWLNDPCYAWVISVDDYCCENEWDDICQLTYNYCDSTYIGPIPARESLGETIIVYPNPTNGKININKKVDVRMYNAFGDIVILENNINVLDVSKLSSGIYNLQITYNNKIINRKIIKK